MSFISKLFTTNAKDLVGEVGNVVDNLTTTQEEKLEAKRKIKEITLSFEAELQKEVSKRWEQDMNSDSWLSKNIRPLTLIFLVFSTVLLIFIDSEMINFKVQDQWIDLLQIILITIIGAYFGGRSYEKIKRL
jgi:cation transport ATPase|tara:strand:- start:129 stop:524 length:396 start_codon:yes stop_codon:yes gene_type:complete